MTTPQTKRYSADVYERLARHLDNLPAGFPPTENGVELRILRRLFMPEEAELAPHLTLVAEEPRVIARRAGLPVADAARCLAQMEKKGLVYAIHRPHRPPRYMAAQFVVGIYEYQVGKLDPELVQDIEEYMPQWWDFDGWKKAPQLRTIPVGESIDPHLDVWPYEQAGELVRGHKAVAVAPCICRQEQHLIGSGCEKPLESCLTFDQAAHYFVRNGMSRWVSQDEALAILARAEEAGLVLQPGNSREVLSICTCCGCCCGVLRNIKRHPKPASIVASAFQATLNPATCLGCGACTGRCQMEALHLDDGQAVLDPDRCIGCGLCVTTCPSGSLRLARKPESEQPHVPRNIVESTIRLGQSRGRMSVGELVGMQVRSVVDRLLAPR